jgi:circadian clock protein KaiB
MFNLITGSKNRMLLPTTPAEPKWMFRLYVAGQTIKSIAARTNLHSICERHIPNRYQVDVIDLLENPKLAKGDQIIAIPTLVRDSPMPVRKIIGDLSNTDKVLLGLDIHPVKIQPVLQP